MKKFISSLGTKINLVILLLLVSYVFLFSLLFNQIGMPVAAGSVIVCIAAGSLGGKKKGFKVVLICIILNIFLFYFFAKHSLLVSLRTGFFPVFILLLSAYISGSLRDLSRRLKHELEVQKKLEKRNRDLQAKVFNMEKMSAIGLLAGGIAHEINNPMSVIMGFTQSMIKRTKSDDSNYSQLKTIEREAIRCKQLINELVLFSHTNDLEMDSLDLNSIINDALKYPEGVAVEKKMEIQKQLNPDIPKTALNYKLLKKAFMLLFNNSIEAMSKGGALLVKTDVVDNELQLIIKDTGLGMSEEVKKHIFEPFFLLQKKLAKVQALA